MLLVLRGIGLESGILVQKFAVRQGSAGRCKHHPLQMFLGQYRIILSAAENSSLLTKKIRPIQNSSHHSKRGGQKFDLQYLG